MIDATIEEYVSAWADGDAERERTWSAIKERLSVVAAREGYDMGQNRFTMTFLDQPRAGDVIRLAYVIHADTVRLRQVVCMP